MVIFDIQTLNMQHYHCGDILTALIPILITKKNQHQVINWLLGNKKRPKNKNQLKLKRFLIRQCIYPRSDKVNENSLEGKLV